VVSLMMVTGNILKGIGWHCSGRSWGQLTQCRFIYFSIGHWVSYCVVCDPPCQLNTSKSVQRGRRARLGRAAAWKERQHRDCTLAHHNHEAINNLHKDNHNTFEASFQINHNPISHIIPSHPLQSSHKQPGSKHNLNKTPFPPRLQLPLTPRPHPSLTQVPPHPPPFTTPRLPLPSPARLLPGYM
jgi:hypothetical protein